MAQSCLRFVRSVYSRSEAERSRIGVITSIRLASPPLSGGRQSNPSSARAGAGHAHESDTRRTTQWSCRRLPSLAPQDNRAARWSASGVTFFDTAAAIIRQDLKHAFARCRANLAEIRIAPNGAFQLDRCAACPVSPDATDPNARVAACAESARRKSSRPERDGVVRCTGQGTECRRRRHPVYQTASIFQRKLNPERASAGRTGTLRTAGLLAPRGRRPALPRSSRSGIPGSA